MKYSYRYRIDQYFSGRVKAYFITLAKDVFWKPAKIIREDQLYDGDNYRHANDRIEEHVAKRRAEEIQYLTHLDDSGRSDIYYI